MVRFFKNLIILLLFYSLICPGSTFPQNYYVNCYEGTGERGELHDIYVKAVDLTVPSITSEIRINDKGYLLSKKPAIVDVNDRSYLISISEFGGFAKNSGPAGSYKVYYSVLTVDDQQLVIVKNDSIGGVMASPIRQYVDETGFRFGLRSDRDTMTVLPDGEYTLDNNLNFQMIRPISYSHEPNVIYNLAGHEYMTKVWNENNINIFYYSGYWLARLANDLSIVLDSLYLINMQNGSGIFAYHPDRDKLYCFHLNYEFHGKFPQYEKDYDYNRIEPEVLIYDPYTFNLLENLPIVDYARGDYPGHENGLAEVVGDFIIYYFFEEDWWPIFAPAMLFIFDTRTNEATWLRVGWR